MRILALETSTDFASCALWQDGQVMSVDCPADTPHSQTLIPLTQKLLAEAGISFPNLDAIAFDKGPGAFTSLRVSCALAQGMASAADIPVLPVGSLECLAWQASEMSKVSETKSDRVLSLLDARMGEFYVGAFSREKENLRPLREIALCRPEAVELPDELPGEDAGSWKVVGNALEAYPVLRERVSRRFSGENLFSLLPHAGALAELAAMAFRRGEGLDPSLALPRYVRDKVARTTAERLAEEGRA